ncbi:hypothetical protein GCM10011506_39480 [Marivirga lumbricoides]|uniref:DUF4199 domain-containing protein n=1 Tax=Marivirga lumbricoides TaxID=1046115 RepID=A0A2T4DR45_9BACT|nr:hypothetical protein C9994_07970 [Marivirga lumbricoides]GGC49973.1 hypothetical protein GCM10011506_39480 [Marivirga lumbricoides]
MKKNTIEYTGIIGGIIILSGLLIYFLIMKALGLAHISELRIFNAVFMFAGIFYTIRTFKKRTDNFSFFRSLGAGFLAASSATLIFSLFMMAYAAFLNPDFLSNINITRSFGVFGDKINPFVIGIVTLSEGMFSGSIMTLGVALWFKRQLTSKEFLREELDSEKTK